MKATLTFFTSLIFSSLLLAQSNIFLPIHSAIYALSLNNNTSLTLNDPIAIGFNNDFEAIEGGPYYQNEWLKGKMILQNGQILGDNWLFKYNTFQDELHIQLETGAVKIPLKNNIQAFMMEENNHQHYFVNSRQAGIEGTEGTTFFEVLHSSQFTLLKQSSKYFGQIASNGFYCSSCDDAPFSFFFSSEKYYLKDENGKFKTVKLNRKSLVKALPKYKTQILSYLKKNKIKMKFETDLLTLLQYLEL